MCVGQQPAANERAERRGCAYSSRGHAAAAVPRGHNVRQRHARHSARNAEVGPSGQVDQSAPALEGGPHPRQPDGQTRGLLCAYSHLAGPDAAPRPGRRAAHNRHDAHLS